MARILIADAGRGFDCADGDTVLRAALRAGLGFPYECNVGACGNCRFELVEGSVVHDRADPPAWSARDQTRNRFLGCQARPRSECRIRVRLDPRYRSAHPPRRRRVRLVETIPVTHDIAEFRVAVGMDAPFRPGQYALFHLEGVEGGRPYSMCNLPAAGGQWHFHVKRVAGGAATSRLFDALAPGNEIEIDGPYGMAYLRVDAPRDILCLAGGSGLSPMISIARAAASSDRLAGRAIHFLYGGRAPRDICGEPMLAGLPGFGKRLHYHAAISDADGADGWSGRTGLVHDVARELFGTRLGEFEIYLAGPPAMAQAVQQMLFATNVPPERIHCDEFY